MIEPKLPPKLNIIKVLRFTGDRKSATLADGKTVYRSESLWMGKQYGLVKCSNTSNHFIYHDPDFNHGTGDWPTQPNGKPFKRFVGRWTPICSCGSPAAVVGSGVYRGSSSPTTAVESTHPGQMLVCLALMQYGIHLDGSHE